MDTSSPMHQELMGTPRGVQPPLRVIYIVGWGHSGSTLLDKIIGTSPGVTSIGEFIFYNFYRDCIPHYKVLLDFVCTCGQPFQACAFWKKVRTLTSRKPLSVVYDTTAKARLQWLFRYGFFLLTGERCKPPQDEMGDDAELLRTIARVGGDDIQFICDSSKDFARLVRLLMNADVEVMPMHLVRDGRGVAYSYTKKWREEAGLNKMGYFAALCYWIAVNLVTRVILRLSGKPFIRISYDQFCRNPRRTIRYLNNRLGLKIPEDRFLDCLNDQVYHNVGGNPGRFNKVEKLHTDDAWRTHVSKPRIVLSTLLIGAFNWLWVDQDDTTCRHRNT